MTDPRRIGVSIDVKPHAYDPAANPELFEGVLARRPKTPGQQALERSGPTPR